MAYFYRNGQLMIGSRSGESGRPVASFLPRPWRKPVYIYDLDDIEKRYRSLEQALAPLPHAIHYAMKANSDPRILKYLGNLGAGVDTVSGGEITRALDAGIAPTKIIFSGVAKTIPEIELALKAGIKQINVESTQELERIAAIARRLGTVADVAFRLNPDVNPQTHPYITTGFRENKFGMDESFVPRIIEILNGEKQWLRPRGLTMHIGSLLFDLGVFREAIEKTIAVHRRFLQTGFELDRLDIGGGIGIRYETDSDREEFSLIEAYGRMACDLLQDLGVEVLTEPGRILVGRSGLLVTEVQYIKATAAKTFVVVDTGMHHLLRPALYGAKHRVLPLDEPSSPKSVYDVVGPICESSDFLARGVELGSVKQGDLFGIADTGAYGFTMASCYNSHELPEQIFVAGGTRAN